jgi:hypothetical protein
VWSELVAVLEEGKVQQNLGDMFLRIESKVWLSHGTEVRNPKAIVFWKSKTQSSTNPRKIKESSQYKLMEAQNLQCKNEDSWCHGISLICDR